MIEICPLCNSRIVRKKVAYNLFGERVGIFPADVCQKCGEQFFSREVSLAIEKIVNDKGLWELKSKTKVSMIGNSFAIRLNKRISNYLDLKNGELVALYPEGKNKIVIDRIREEQLRDDKPITE